MLDARRNVVRRGEEGGMLLVDGLEGCVVGRCLRSLRRLRELCELFREINLVRSLTELVVLAVKILFPQGPVWEPYLTKCPCGGQWVREN